MHKKSNPLAVISLIFFNLLPLYGVNYRGWNLFSILLIYWLENFVIGFYNLLKISKAAKPSREPVTVNYGSRKIKTFAVESYIVFFFIHYGIFTTAHGMVLFSIFKSPAPVFEIALVLFSLFVSHGISYHTNFIGKEEYLHISPSEQMFAPYYRVVVMHVTVLAGAVFIKSTGSPISVLVILVLVKTVVDLILHFSEHKNFLKGSTS